MRWMTLGSILLSVSVFAADRYVAETGVDTGDCTDPLNSCLTLQYAIDQSAAGDTINVASGTYTTISLVMIDKTLTILGAQNGVDARTRSGDESVLSNIEGISVTANAVVIDGFTIKDSSNPVYTGYGLLINPGIDGTHVVNNIFENNIAGLGLANVGATQAVIQYNYFHDNNLPGGISGTGIYTDQYVGGTVDNVLIDNNAFANNENAGIGLSSTDPNFPESNFTITNNTVDNSGRGFYFFNVVSSSVSNNSITNSVDPTDGGFSVALGIYGGVNGLTISNNNLETGTLDGIRIENITGDNNNFINIHENNISGFAEAGLFVVNYPVGAIDYATCNWWGNPTGPTTLLNPSGMGDKIFGEVIFENFHPWLLAPAPDGICGGVPPSVSKIFDPSHIYQGHISTVVITLTNVNNIPANITAPLVDYMSYNIVVQADAPHNDCGGIVTAPAGGSVITLFGGAIPAGGSCTIHVKVTSYHEGLYENVIPAGALQTDLGSNVDEADAFLRVFGHFDSED